MNDLLKSEEFVKELFQKYPETRNDDDLLYWKYVEVFTGVGNFERLFYDKKFRHDWKVLSYKSIVRSARKIREKFPEFRPSKAIQEAKKEKENEYMTYSQI